MKLARGFGVRCSVAVVILVAVFLFSGNASAVTHWCCSDSSGPLPSLCTPQSGPCSLFGADVFDVQTSDNGAFATMGLIESPIPNVGVCPSYNLSQPGGNPSGGAPGCFWFPMSNITSVMGVTVSTQLPAQGPYTWSLCYGAAPCPGGTTVDSFGECCAPAQPPATYIPAGQFFYAQFSIGSSPSSSTTLNCSSWGFGANCGLVPNGSGGELSCGTCVDHVACNQGQCACNPTTCSALGATCGTPPDGCGGTLASCGFCSGGQTCSQQTFQCTSGGPPPTTPALPLLAALVLGSGIAGGGLKMNRRRARGANGRKPS